MNTDKKQAGMKDWEWLVALILAGLCVIGILATLTGCKSTPVYSPVPPASTNDDSRMRFILEQEMDLHPPDFPKPTSNIEHRTSNVELPPEPALLVIHPADRIRPEVRGQTVSQASAAPKVLPVILENPDRGPLWALIVQNERVTEPMERWGVVSQFLAQPGTNRFALPMTNTAGFFRARWK